MTNLIVKLWEFVSKCYDFTPRVRIFKLCSFETLPVPGFEEKSYNNQADGIFNLKSME